MFKKRKKLSVWRESHAVPTTQIGNHSLLCISLFMCVLLTVGLVADAWSGELRGVARELKLELTRAEVTTNKRVRLKNFMSITLVSGWGERNGRTYTRTSWEVVTFTTITFEKIRIYNYYPVIIELPQPDGRVDLDLPIDIYFVMMVDPGDGIGPLPDDAIIEEASLIGSSGTEYPAEIIPIDDLEKLPTSSDNNLEIGWDLSEVAQTTGNFFLSKVTLPNTHELIGPDIPAASHWGLVVMALILLAAGTVMIVRRKQRITA